MYRKLRIYRVYLMPLSLLQYVWCDTHNQSRNNNIWSPPEGAKPHKRRSNAHNHKIVARVQELVNTDPSKLMRAMARELEVSATLVRKIVNEDLRYKSYGLRKFMFLYYF